MKRKTKKAVVEKFIVKHSLRGSSTARIEEALLDLALRIEAGGKWYDKQHPEGIYQHIAGVLFGGKTLTAKKPKAKK